MLRLKGKIAIAVMLTGLGIHASAETSAETSAEDARDYRTAVMTSLRGHVAAASMHVRGLVEGREFLAHHADALAKGVTELKHVFPEGSNVGDSEALPEIWDNPEAFSRAVEEAENAAGSFNDAVATGDRAAIGSAFRELGMSCRGCHDRFRRNDG